MRGRVRCTDGREADSFGIEERHAEDGRPRRYVYGYVYNPERRRTERCYVGPAEPGYVIGSLPAAYLAMPGEWAPALEDSLARLAENVLAYRPELAPGLARALARALAELARASPEARREAAALEEALRELEGEGEGERLPA